MAAGSAAGCAAQVAHAGAGVDSAGACGSHGDARLGAGVAAAGVAAAPKENGSSSGKGDAAEVGAAAATGRGAVPSDSRGGGGTGFMLLPGLGKLSRGAEACSMQVTLAIMRWPGRHYCSR